MMTINDFHFWVNYPFKLTFSDLLLAVFLCFLYILDLYINIYIYNFKAKIM